MKLRMNEKKEIQFDCLEDCEFEIKSVTCQDAPEYFLTTTDGRWFVEGKKIGRFLVEVLFTFEKESIKTDGRECLDIVVLDDEQLPLRLSLVNPE